MGGECSTNGEKSKAHMLLLRKPERNKPLGKPGRSLVDNIKIRVDLVEIGMGWCRWISLAQDRDKCRALVNAVMNLRVP
jgi:hypothetical protein